MDHSALRFYSWSTNYLMHPLASYSKSLADFLPLLIKCIEITSAAARGSFETRLCQAEKAEGQAVSTSLDPKIERDGLDELVEEFNEAKRSANTSVMKKTADRTAKKHPKPEVSTALASQSGLRAHCSKRRRVSGDARLRIGFIGGIAAGAPKEPTTRWPMSLARRLPLYDQPLATQRWQRVVAVSSHLVKRVVRRSCCVH